MASVSATLRNYRKSPRKVRLVTRFVSGKPAVDAVEELRFAKKHAAQAVRKVIESALANARVKGLRDDLIIRTITVNEGMTLKRGMPRARGSMSLIRKRTSHIFVELEERDITHQQSPEHTNALPVSEKQEKTTS